MHKIKFTELSEKYAVNKSVKGKISELHALLITYVVGNFRDTNKYKQMVVDALNLITYAVYADEPLPFSWSPKCPFDNLPNIDQDEIADTLGDVMLSVDCINWDMVPIYTDNNNNLPEINSDVSEQPQVTKPSISTKLPPRVNKDVTRKVHNITATTNSDTSETVINPTHKHDLYIQPPNIPQFDVNKIWMSGVDGADQLVIYTTLPEIPTKQNEISCTTDVSHLTYDELIRLYPNCIIHTRAAVMYEKCDGINLDPDLGLILPIEGYTIPQLIDNLIKYPHLYKLNREIDGSFVSFYSNIEIEGKLHNTLDIWDSIPESKIIPKQAEFVKEYVVRRYLLERDIKGIDHTYPVFGTLDPFLTLFMTPTHYINHGYKDIEDLAKSCVLSRVKYKQSHNPVIRRLTADV